MTQRRRTKCNTIKSTSKNSDIYDEEILLMLPERNSFKSHVNRIQNRD